MIRGVQDNSTKYFFNLSRSNEILGSNTGRFMEPHLFDFEWVVRGEGWGAKTASSNLLAVDP